MLLVHQTMSSRKHHIPNANANQPPSKRGKYQYIHKPSVNTHSPPTSNTRVPHVIATKPQKKARPQQLLSNSRKFKIITISTTAYISSAFNLYSNPWTYLETSLSNLSYTEFSVPLDDHNSFKTHGVVMYETNYMISIDYLNNWIHN